METLWREDALVGETPSESYWVKVDAENNPPEVVDQGHLVIDVGFAAKFGSLEQIRVTRGFPDSYQPA